ncbi:MAG TPA: hypothetical protein EYN18_02645 [Nitrospirales bacterium]|jgi:hypothetical protein|nr:hypothetical protein [Nitrospirales bacterium]HIO69272.1 hypothetical protein [Nitrospirales bacterium]
MQQRSAGRKLVKVMRGSMMLCGTCYESVIEEKLMDDKTYVEDYHALFDIICPGCDDLNLPLVQDMLGSSE